MITLSGPALADVDRQSALYESLRRIHPRLAAKDPSIWGESAREEASIRLNWVDLPTSSRALLPIIANLSSTFGAFTNVILCGMGGSSLGPEVIAATYGKRIFILDSTDPDYLAHALDSEMSSTVIIIGSKSGSTLETSSQRLFFERHLVDAGLSPQKHIVIVTDPGSPLDTESRAQGYAVINADPNVGGRFSVLSAFGLVPSALCGAPIAELIESASKTKSAFLNDPSVVLDTAYLLTAVVQQYCGFTDDRSGLPGLSDWIEQLIAESTGKDGKGRLPVVTESAAAARAVGFGITFADGGDLNVVGDLGSQFIFWEWVTALVGAALGIDPFNQPNVTEAKEQSSSLLKEWNGRVPSLVPNSVEGELEFYGPTLQELLSQVEPDGYIAIMAYLDRIAQSDLAELRSIIAERTGRPVTFGWGPRFLHSTGQFHKAGQPNGVFLQISGECSENFLVPTKNYSFETLINAQCQGDGRALAARGYPVTRIHLRDRRSGVDELLALAKKI